MTCFVAVGRERSPLFPVLEHSAPRLWQAWQGCLSSHLIRFKRHHSQARATWLRLGRAMAAAPSLVVVGEVRRAKFGWSRWACFFWVAPLVGEMPAVTRSSWWRGSAAKVVNMTLKPRVVTEPQGQYSALIKRQGSLTSGRWGLYKSGGHSAINGSAYHVNDDPGYKAGVVTGALLKKIAPAKVDYVRDVDFAYNGDEKDYLRTTTSPNDMTMDHDDAKICSGEIRMQQQSISRTCTGNSPVVLRSLMRLKAASVCCIPNPESSLT